MTRSKSACIHGQTAPARARLALCITRSRAAVAHLRPLAGPPDSAATKVSSRNVITASSSTTSAAKQQAAGAERQFKSRFEAVVDDSARSQLHGKFRQQACADYGLDPIAAPQQNVSKAGFNLYGVLYLLHALCALTAAVNLPTAVQVHVLCFFTCTARTMCFSNSIAIGSLQVELLYRRQYVGQRHERHTRVLACTSCRQEY